jgi:long-chain acyl-CoA synthetase
MVDPSLKQMKNKLSTNEGRLDLVKEVTKDGMLALEKANIRGNDYFVFKDAPKNLRDYYQLGLLHGDWTHIVYEDERYQFAETLKYSNQLANTLQSKFNIQKGDKVALSMRNYPEWMFSYIAATSIGAVIVPLNSWWKGDELEYGITNSEAKNFHW